MDRGIPFPKENNLDLLRLVFSLQVALSHVSSYMPGFAIPDFVSHFPGVPAFFFVSGFLVYTSYLNSKGFDYVVNRFLRIFPGLFVVVLFSTVVVYVAKGSDFFIEELSTIIVWIIAQITLGQAYNPSEFRDVGVGVLNGSLWTITVEVFFYIAVPIIVFIESKVKWAVVWLMMISSFIYYVGPGVFSEAVYHDKTVFDVLELTPIVWGWMFGVGILVAKYYYLLEKYFKYFFIFGLMCIFLLFLQLPGFESSGNRLGVGYYFVYVGFILWIAFCLPSIRLGGDISYGVYIWHMPVVNLLLVLGFDCPVFAITLTLFFAIISWVVVEKPALKFKHHTLRRV